MFQPGEEGHGGAKIMLEEGLLSAAGEPPIATYSMRVSPGQHGVIVTRRFDAFDPVVLSETVQSTSSRKALSWRPPSAPCPTNR